MSEINFDLPSGKRTFRIDDIEITTEQGLDNLLDESPDIPKLIIKVESLQIDIKELINKMGRREYFKGRKPMELSVFLQCGLCEAEFKKGDTVYEQVRTIYDGQDETYPVEVMARWCEDCEAEMQKRLNDNLAKIEFKEKRKLRR